MELYNLSPDPDKVYKDTELMLEKYRDLVWRLEESVEDIKDKVYYGRASSVQSFSFISLDMSEYDNQQAKQLLRKGSSALMTRIIVDAIDKAMLKLKSYPANGEILSAPSCSLYWQRTASSTRNPGPTSYFKFHLLPLQKKGYQPA